MTGSYRAPQEKIRAAAHHAARAHDHAGNAAHSTDQVGTLARTLGDRARRLHIDSGTHTAAALAAADKAADDAHAVHGAAMAAGVDAAQAAARATQAVADAVADSHAGDWQRSAAECDKAADAEQDADAAAAAALSFLRRIQDAAAAKGTRHPTAGVVSPQ